MSNGEREQLYRLTKLIPHGSEVPKGELDLVNTRRVSYGSHFAPTRYAKFTEATPYLDRPTREFTISQRPQPVLNSGEQPVSKIIFKGGSGYSKDAKRREKRRNRRNGKSVD